MKKLGKKNDEILETIEAYAGHGYDCSDAEYCFNDCTSYKNKYSINTDKWHAAAYD